MREKHLYEDENMRLKETIYEKDEEIENLNKSLTKEESEYNLISFPKVPLKDIQVKLTTIDPLIANTLIEYLTLDSFEIVKNLAKVTNSENAANVIAYRDGAIGRNEGLIQRLRGLSTIEEYKDRISGKMRMKGAEKAETKKD